LIQSFPNSDQPRLVATMGDVASIFRGWLSAFCPQASHLDPRS
jgi:hypothetical protein